MELVYVEWIDSDASSTWQWKSTWVHHITQAKTIGWLIDEDEDNLSLTSTIAPNPRDGDVQIMGYVAIPKVAITLRKTLPVIENAVELA